MNTINPEWDKWFREDALEANRRNLATMQKADAARHNAEYRNRCNGVNCVIR